MATVPTDFVPNVTPTGSQGYRSYQSYQAPQANPADFGGQVGQTLQATGDTLAKHAIQRQAVINEAATQDTINKQYEPQFRDLYTKFYSLQGKDAEDQFPQYEKAAEDLRVKIRDSFTNPEQQRMFDAYSGSRKSRELDGMARHAAAQTKAWLVETYHGAQDGYVNMGADKWNDPKALSLAKNSIIEEATSFHNRHGGSPEMREADIRKYTDKLYQIAIVRQALTDPVGAQQAFQAVADNISGETQMRIASHLKPLVDAQTSRKIASDILINPGYNGGKLRAPIVSAATQAGLDPHTVLTVASLENREFDPKAKNPKSNAQGLFQVIDSTWESVGGTPEERGDVNKQIEYGVKSLKASSGYLAGKLGRPLQPFEFYLSHQQGGEGAAKLIQNLGANAAGLVGQKAIINNGGTADMTAGEFVEMWRGKYDQRARAVSADGTPNAQQIRQNFLTLENEVKARAEAERPGDAVYRDTALSRFRQEVGLVLTADYYSAQASQQTLTQAIAGPNGAKTLQELLSTPERVKAYSDLFDSNPTAIPHIRSMLEHNAKGMPTPENAKAYYDLVKMSQDNPLAFAGNRTPQNPGRDLMQDYPNLEPSKWHELVKLQEQMREGKKDPRIENLHQAVEGELNAFFPSNSKPKQGSKALDDWNVARANAYKAIGDSIKAEQDANNGKVVAPERAREIARGYLVNGTLSGTGFLGIGVKRGRGFELQDNPAFTPNQTQIPSRFIKKIEDIKAESKGKITPVARFDASTRNWYLVINGQKYEYPQE